MITVINPAAIAAGEAQTITPDVTKFDFAKSQIALVVAELQKYTTINALENVQPALDTLKVASEVAKAIEKKRVQLVEPFNDGSTKINAYKKDLVKDLDADMMRVKNAILAFQEAERKRQTDLMILARRTQLGELGFIETRPDQYTLENIGAVSLNEIHNYEASTWGQVISGFVEQIRIAAEAKKNELEKSDELFDVFGSEDEKAAVKEEIKTASTPVAVPKSNFNGYSPNVKGTTKTWAFEITDAAQVPRQYMEINESLIRKAVQAGTRDIPGIKIFQKESLSIR